MRTSAPVPASAAAPTPAPVIAARPPRTGTDGKTPAPTTGYVHKVYELRVVKWISGTGAEKLVLRQGAEADGKQLSPGGLLFFSACPAKDGSVWEPDVGYVFPVDPSCRAEVEKMGEAAAKRATAIGKRKKACAKTK